MAWYRTGGKPIAVTMLAKVYGAKLWHWINSFSLDQNGTEPEFREHRLEWKLNSIMLNWVVFDIIIILWYCGDNKSIMVYIMASCPVAEKSNLRTTMGTFSLLRPYAFMHQKTVITFICLAKFWLRTLSNVWQLPKYPTLAYPVNHSRQIACMIKCTLSWKKSQDNKYDECEKRRTFLQEYLP